MLTQKKNKMSSKMPLISLIIPAFKQEINISDNISRIKKVMDQLKYDYEIIVVVDGMGDNTFKNANRKKNKKIIVTGYKHNHGKGYAIRYGMVRSKGDIVGFIDAGMDLNPTGLAFLIEQFQWHDADIIIGSKRHSLSKVNYPKNRRVISLLSQILIRMLFGLNIKDTQVGMKFFKREVLEDIFPRLLVKRFAFDIEILVVAYNLGYKKILEAPIELNFNLKDSGVSKNLFQALFKTLWDTLAIFYRLRIINYYSDANKRRWKYDPELNFRINVS